MGNAKQDSINRILEAATANDSSGVRNLPGVSFMATDIKKSQSYAHAAGLGSWTASMPNSSSEIKLDSVCFGASMTKLMTSVAAMQCVERGLIGLDDDVSSVLHEWKEAQILEGFGEDGKPMLKKAKNKITLRLLLSHSSGITYDVLDPRLLQWRQYMGQEPGTFSGSIDVGYTFPLVFEPGEGWMYGAGLDWAGRLVERLNDNVRLGTYMQTNIWDPLGMTSTTFQIDKNHALQARLVEMSIRNASGIIEYLPTPVFASPAVDDCGGIGIYTTAPNYSALLNAILNPSPSKLLKPETIDEMFTPQLPDTVHLDNVLAIPGMRTVLAENIPKEVKVNYGLGGMLNMEDLPTGRKAGGMQWGGMPNLFWWIDRESGVAGTYFSQLMPTGDAAAIKLFTELEAELYKES